jgi:hypothetical protein
VATGAKPERQIVANFQKSKSGQSGFPERFPHCSWSVHARAGQALEEFSLQDSLAIGVDRMQRNFEPMPRQAEQWRAQQLSTANAGFRHITLDRELRHKGS